MTERNEMNDIAGPDPDEKGQASPELPKRSPQGRGSGSGRDSVSQDIPDTRIAKVTPLGDQSTLPDPARRPRSPGEKTPSGGTMIERLQSYSVREERYDMKGELARGGMGAILKVWDRDLRRNLAMKVVLGKDDADQPGSTPSVDDRTLGRFLEEAQVTSQLDHPGVVPVHELGLDANGQVYFTMALVKGRDLSRIFELVHKKREGWSLGRAVGVILKVCEAMAYAHAKGVIHRDLKPSNIMVGRFGEVYVMDWGLAKVLGQEDKKDIRVRPKPTVSVSVVRTERSTESTDSALVTMDGDVVGTPAYMSPEQARGDLAAMGPHSDVYSLGAILYHLIAGHMPYSPPRARVNGHAIWGMVQNGPPTALDRSASDAPEELISICEKAMARDPSQRYADTKEMEEDLQALIEGRVVKAHGGGTWVELRKWVLRNRRLAAASALTVLALCVGLIATGIGYRALQRESEAQTERAQALKRVSGLSDGKLLEWAQTAAAELWPASTDRVPHLQQWLDEHAAPLLERKPVHESHLEELRLQALAAEVGPREVSDTGGTEAKTESTEPAQSSEPEELRFSDVELQWQHDELRDLVRDLKQFADPDQGTVASVQRRLTFAREVRERTIDGAEAQTLWSAAIADIATLETYAGLELAPQEGLLPLGRNPRTGLWEFWHLQTGEKPLPNPDWSFSGSEVTEKPKTASNNQPFNRWRITGETGLVFVLIPAGTFRMGATVPSLGAVYEETREKLRVQKVTPGQLGASLTLREGDSLVTLNGLAVNTPGDVVSALSELASNDEVTLVVLRDGAELTLSGSLPPSNYDPLAQPNESPVREVTLEPYFLSKYEMTQSQWKRFVGRNPSKYPIGWDWSGKQSPVAEQSPVEQVSWKDCKLALDQLGLTLPTEAQWENAARAQTATRWWCGHDKMSIEATRAGNLADAWTQKQPGAPRWTFESWLNDQWGVHAPVGTFRPNPYGLHDTIGNVGEWCRDVHAEYKVDPAPGDGERTAEGARLRIARGGTHTNSAPAARTTDREDATPSTRYGFLGIRPARPIR